MLITVLVVMFIFGIVVGLITGVGETPRQRSCPSTSNKKLDASDDMFLYGAVTDDEFYRM